MKDVSHHGRTILFVSHNMAAVKALCPRAILLKDGAIAATGNTQDIVDDYLLNALPEVSASEWPDPATAPGNEDVRVAYIRVIPPENEAAITIDTGGLIEIGFHSLRKNIALDCTVYLSSRDGTLIFESGHLISSDRDSRCGFYHLVGRIPGHLLNAGRYSLDVQFGKDQSYVLFRIDEPVSFEVENTTTGRGSNMSVAPGLVRPKLAWEHDFAEEYSLIKERS
jgi:lipopolysaccharide transport system ATP-binding protein